jgi:hypothetical protein
LIEVNKNPSSRDVRIFGLLWLLFFGLVGGVVLWKPQGLAGAATILGTAWLVSLIFNRENRLLQLLGVLLPGLFAVSSASAGWVGPSRVAGSLWAIGAVGAVLIWIVPSAGRQLYVGWMLAAVPIGWTISHVVLAVVYYVVLTPIGLLMRLVGRDPMQRRLDRSGSGSYWIERPPRRDSSSYFRQF